MAKAVRNVQQKKKEQGFPYKFRRVMEDREAREGRPRLLETYESKVRPHLEKEFGYANPYEGPRIKKVVLNIGLGEALKTPKVLEQAFESLGMLTGQRPVVTRAKKSIAGFKVREGMKLGCMVTLRGPRMWEFLDRLLNVALPRTRDFRGVSRKAFDGRGNYTFGIRELLIFPEVDIEKLDHVPGMNICVHTTANNDDEGRALLGSLGVPFRQA
jgi:large subunit ribosomal protein L5